MNLIMFDFLTIGVNFDFVVFNSHSMSYTGFSQINCFLYVCYCYQVLFHC